MLDVQYPEAYLYDKLRGTKVQTGVESAEKEGTYLCVGCGTEMRPVQGLSGLVQWHFRHKHNADGVSCNPDLALHKMAQGKVILLWEAAQQAGEPYMLRLPGPCLAKKACRPFIGEWDCVTAIGRITSEDRALIPPYIPDIVIRTGTETYVLEIEVTSLMEAKHAASEAYKASGYLTLRKRFTSFSQLAELADGFVADSEINFPHPCNACRAHYAGWLKEQEQQSAQLRRDTGRAEPSPDVRRLPAAVHQGVCRHDGCDKLISDNWFYCPEHFDWARREWAEAKTRSGYHGGLWGTYP